MAPTAGAPATGAKTIFGREPAVILGALNALLAVAAGFGIGLTGEQVALVSGAATALVALYVRHKVTPWRPDKYADWAAEKLAAAAEELKDEDE